MNNANQTINLNINVPSQIGSKNKMQAAIALASVIRQLFSQCEHLSEKSKLEVMGVAIAKILSEYRPNMTNKKLSELYKNGMSIANNPIWEIHTTGMEASL